MYQITTKKNKGRPFNRQLWQLLAETGDSRGKSGKKWFHFHLMQTTTAVALL